MDKQAKNRKLIIVGASAFAEIAYEYFTYDSDYDVVAFAVETPYLLDNNKYGLPLVAFETMEQRFPPMEHEVLLQRRTHNLIVFGLV